MSDEVLKQQRLTVVIPVFNEQQTIVQVVDKVLLQPTVSQVIVVNDGSTDNTPLLLSKLSDKRIRVIHLDRNRGKGFAIQEALPLIESEFTLIQDADLEYDPSYYPRLLSPIIEKKADVVYGSRFLTSEERRVLYFWHYIANKSLTLLSNAKTNLNLSDMETGFKAFRTVVIADLMLMEKRFGFEPEVTAKLARKGLRFYEVSIGYHGRSYADGKKIRFKDALRALYCVFKY